MLYRAFRRLDIGVEAGELFSSDRLKPHVLTVLEERGIIAPVASPPLADLPVWAERQESLGVDTLADVIEADPTAYENRGQVAEWQREAKELLQYPAPDGWYLKDPGAVTQDCGGCKGKAATNAKTTRARRRRE